MWRGLLSAVLLCWLSVVVSARNATINHTEPEENHETFTEDLLHKFFENYADKNGSISPILLCNFTQKLSSCAGKPSNDDGHGHGHGHGHEKTKEVLKNAHDHKEDGHDEEKKGKQNGEHDKGHEEHKDEHKEDKDGHSKDKDGHSEDKDGHEKDKDGHDDDEDHDEKQKCHGVYKVLADHNFTESSSIKEEDFIKLSPALYAVFVQQINKKRETKPPKKVEKHKLSQGEVWGYATVAITIISLSSLLVIAVIPLLGKSFYNKIMSFLVALAIGCLAGDALLHLIPHSLVPHSEHNHGAEEAKEDKQALFRAFIVFVGIYMFFLVECCMKLKLARRKKTDKRILYGAGKQQLAKQLADGQETARLSTAVEAVTEPDPESAASEQPTRASLNAFIMEVTSGNRRSSRQVRDSLWMAYMAAMDDNGEITAVPEDGLPSPTGREHYRSNRESYAGRKIDTLREEDSREDLLQEIPEVNHREKSRTNSEGLANSKGDGTDTESQETQSKHNNNHNHNHNHGQEKQIDKTTKIASLAWMVIVGDGFHNLADGLAVGAAFSASFTSGLSTAVAVFCHELPHELGDFAVLVKAGMSVKQAITYNMISAVIAFLGMIVGILIGSNKSAILWVLALTAGMFLYISLVDMLPELCTQLAEEDFKTGLWTFFYQNLGILTGVLIMYLISLME